MYKQELKISKIAARQAGIFLKKEFFKWHNDKLRYKANNERVTWCDKESEKIIFKILNKHFPDYAILSEESGKNNKISDYSWVIDPLDGTTNFTIHHSMFAVSIALYYKKELVMGVTYNPILDEMYFASLGNGAFKDNKKLKVSPHKKLKESLITYCHGAGDSNRKKAYKLYKNFHEKSHHCRHFGCTTLELAMLAAGNTEAHIITGAKLWDVSAGIIIVREAGGKVTNWQSNKWTKDSSTLLASNKKIHNICLKELKSLKLA